MNAVEIEEAISNLAEQAFDAASFPYAFLEAFGNKVTPSSACKAARPMPLTLKAEFYSVAISILPFARRVKSLPR